MLTIGGLKNIVLDILFPPICFACNRSLGEDEKPRQLCAACSASVPIYDTLLCPVCGNRLPNGKIFCHPRAGYLLAAATRYDNSVARNLIHELKYRCVRAASVPLANIMIAYLNSLRIDLKNYTAVPVPLHKKREQARGFNQARLLAEKISEAKEIPLAENALQRIKNTAPQAETKDKKSRRENLAGCFTALPELVRGKKILLVDDVHTSGATAHEAVAALQIAGAKSVLVLVAARA